MTVRRSRNLRYWNGLAFLMTAVPLFAHDPITTKLTWTQEISRLVYKHCASCHREGGAAMRLTTYAEARPWAKAIRDEVLARRMPPWGPVKGVGHFAGDPSLSLPELEMFVLWVEGGAPEGDPALLPSKLPAVPAPTPPLRVGREVAVSRSAVLDKAATVVALRPVGLRDNESLEAWATRPDGTLERLIWLKDYRTAFALDYRLRAPLRLPRGTRIEVRSAAAGASLILLCD